MRDYHPCTRWANGGSISSGLADYAARSGHPDDARDCLRRAFELEPGLRLKGLDDLDLAPLW